MLIFYRLSVPWLLFMPLQGRCLALIQAASDVQEQGAVDDRDSFLHGVRDLLSMHSSKDNLPFKYSQFKFNTGLLA